MKHRIQPTKYVWKCAKSCYGAAGLLSKVQEVHERDLERGSEGGRPPSETEGTTDRPQTCRHNCYCRMGLRGWEAASHASHAALRTIRLSGAIHRMIVGRQGGYGGGAHHDVSVSEISADQPEMLHLHQRFTATSFQQLLHFF